MLTRADSGDTEETPPETVIETPVLITPLLRKENQTETKNEEKFVGKCWCGEITLLESGHTHRSEPSED